MSTPSTPRQAAQHAARTIRRDAAVAAAARLFAADGFHATAMADVANAAGISLKALYASFPSKDELFAAVLTTVGRRFAGLFDDTPEDADATARLTAFVHRLLERMAEYPDALRLYSRGADGIPATMRERGVDPFAGYTEQVREGIAATFRRAQAGRADAGPDPMVLARAVLAMCVAEARHRLDAGLPVADAAADLAPLIAAFVDAR